ncbi:hypothetical protein [Xanthomonas oryzae]|nr:hypothetical protein [Xanthomonas oryzae]AJQ81866.1 hypothetical protein AZ54_03860 [Xanthomonas oryzae pv. oryzae PXO86]ALZ70729.1 hypothetical protein APZ20_03570 [Xanthomonas oryzae pv. oryzae]AOS04746.1 hypothetical protein ATY42_19505 [Xanthomonas oryzae pv. oryzae]AOS08811.1 hypothetical protein ATY43_15850 [Xanthomonas oryzae pv. oryzae]AOS12772.1 hypothetical protein ATY44_03595 [Xanthomonas oryzae pv. oryzae]
MSPPAQIAALENGCDVHRWRSYWPFALSMAMRALAARAAAYLTHDSAHSVTAWCLGWMARPFGIDYGAAILGDVLLLGDVSDNVDSAPIFSSGHGWADAAIALAGPFLGNGAMYGVAAWVARWRVVRRSRGLLGFCLSYALMR